MTSAKMRLTSVAVVRARTTPPASNGCTAGSILATWTGTSTGGPGVGAGRLARARARGHDQRGGQHGRRGKFLWVNIVELA